jgi:hypothetical protein
MYIDRATKRPIGRFVWIVRNVERMPGARMGLFEGSNVIYVGTAIIVIRLYNVLE